MRRILFLAIAALAFAVPQARASITYSYATDFSSYQAGSSGVVTVNLYLVETLSGGSKSYLASNYNYSGADPNINTGLTGVGLGLNVTSGSATMNPSLITFNQGSSAYESQTAFGQNGLTAAAPYTQSGKKKTINNGPYSQVALAETVPASTTGNFYGVLGTQNASGGYTVLIGSVQVAAAANTTSTITLVNTGAQTGLLAQNSNVTGNGSILDNDGSYTDTTTGITYNWFGAGDAAATYSFTVNGQVTAVPEPSSMILCGFAGCAMGVGAWRRYRGKNVSVPATEVA